MWWRENFTNSVHHFPVNNLHRQSVTLIPVAVQRLTGNEKIAESQVVHIQVHNYACEVKVPVSSC